MNIGILHFSDLHFTEQFDNTDSIVKACKYDINDNISNLYIVITGDIIDKGIVGGYDSAEIFLKELQKKIKPNNTILNVKMIMVPGNHDCDFKDDNPIRELVGKACQNDILDKEEFVAEMIKPQAKYWVFYEKICGEIPEDKLSYVKSFMLKSDENIEFHCYNTSWLSTSDEKVGSIVIPENKFLQRKDNTLIVSLFHHPLNWFSPNTNNNNKSRFEDHLIKSSDIVFFGHEHDKGQSLGITKGENNTLFCEGKAFQEMQSKTSGFTYIKINLDNRELNIKSFQWNGNEYDLETEDKFSLVVKKTRNFSFTESFLEQLETIDIPLKHPKKDTLKLQDIFIYPDLEPIIQDDCIQYPNSEEILRIAQDNNLKILIEGDDQSGKTALLFTYCKRLYELGFYPIYLKGEQIKSTNIKQILKQPLKDQYNISNINTFLQNEKIFILVDNFQKNSLTSSNRRILINNLNQQFNYIALITNKNLTSNLMPEELHLFNDFTQYKILPLGHVKRADLIEKWLKIGNPELSIEDEFLFKNIKTKLDEINNLLGNRLMPSYPVFVLTLLQGLEAQIFTSDYTQTSYAHCYQALITIGLVKIGLHEKLSSYFHILKELSFKLFKGDLSCFNLSYFFDFFHDIKKSYFIDGSPENMLKNLENANILRLEDEYYSFSYKYIYYYLIAQKISANVNENQCLIDDLCSNIHIERNANVLIFLTHHTKDNLLLDNLILSSEIPFENCKAITLDKDDPFTSYISQLMNIVKNDIIEDVNPHEEIGRDLKKKDVLDSKNSKLTTTLLDENNELPSEIIELNQAFRSIKILGQIVKNQKGDFEKEKLEELVVSSYNTCFRFISFFANILEQNKGDLIQAIYNELEKTDRKINREVIEKKVESFFQFLGYRICIDSFTNLMFSVGTRNVDELFDNVAKRINTSAAKIVTFAIKSYYGNINVNDLRKLFTEVNNNYIAQSILRIYVRKFLYTNKVERTKRQRIIDIAGFKQDLDIAKRLNKQQKILN